MEGWDEQRRTLLGGLGTEAADGIKARTGVREISRRCGSFFSSRTFFRLVFGLDARSSK